MEAVVERLLPWLKHDIYSSDSSNPRTPSPEIELGEIFEFEVENETPKIVLYFSSLFC